jgi:peptide deformylase
VDRELRQVVREMFELMYEANGVGLAANQVDLPLRLFIVNLAGSPGEGEEHVFINPVISHVKGTDEKEEGCLSLPGLYGNVKRPEKIKFSAFNLQGEEIEADLDGLFARVVQHENDHLDGILFIDRLSPTGVMAAEDSVQEFDRSFTSARNRGEIPDDATILARLKEWEGKYC